MASTNNVLNTQHGRGIFAAAEGTKHNDLFAFLSSANDRAAVSSSTLSTSGNSYQQKQNSSSTSSSSSSSGTMTYRSSMKFLVKLHKVLSDSEHEKAPSQQQQQQQQQLQGTSATSVAEIISWSSDGQSFKIHNKDKFAKEILPVYFPSYTLGSFQRDLILCGFKQYSTTSSILGDWSHCLFRRDFPGLCEAMEQILNNNSSGGGDLKNNSGVAASFNGNSISSTAATNAGSAAASAPLGSVTATNQQRQDFSSPMQNKCSQKMMSNNLLASAASSAFDFVSGSHLGRTQEHKGKNSYLSSVSEEPLEETIPGTSSQHHITGLMANNWSVEQQERPHYNNEDNNEELQAIMIRELLQSVLKKFVLVPRTQTSSSPAPAAPAWSTIPNTNTEEDLSTSSWSSSSNTSAAATSAIPESSVRTMSTEVLLQSALSSLISSTTNQITSNNNISPGNNSSLASSPTAVNLLSGLLGVPPLHQNHSGDVGTTTAGSSRTNGDLLLSFLLANNGGATISNDRKRGNESTFNLCGVMPHQQSESVKRPRLDLGDKGRTTNDTATATSSWMSSLFPKSSTTATNSNLLVNGSADGASSRLFGGSRANKNAYHNYSDTDKDKIALSSSTFPPAGATAFTQSWRRGGDIYGDRNGSTFRSSLASPPTAPCKQQKQHQLLPLSNTPQTMNNAKASLLKEPEEVWKLFPSLTAAAVQLLSSPRTNNNNGVDSSLPSWQQDMASASVPSKWSQEMKLLEQLGRHSRRQQEEQHLQE